MCDLRTYLGTLLVALAMTAPAQAQVDLHKTFAGCVGRLSAEMEHAWLLSDPAADDLEADRLVFLSLLEATATTDRSRQMLNYRIDVKLAHARLLTLATFSEHEDRAAEARAAALRLLTACRRLLLDG